MGDIYQMLLDNPETRKYIREQTRWLKQTGLKIGDRVKIIGKAASYQSGWPTVWTDQMSEKTGGSVRYITSAGIAFTCDDGEDSAYYPFFVLVKEEDDQERD